MKILFVEDRPELRRAGVKVLAFSKKHQVEEAGDGQEALQKLEQFHADLVITDNAMPVMDGPELIRRAKQLNPDIHTILSGADSLDADIRTLARECGADKAFPKPIDWEELLETIRAWEI